MNELKKLAISFCAVLLFGGLIELGYLGGKTPGPYIALGQALCGIIILIGSYMLLPTTQAKSSREGI